VSRRIYDSRVLAVEDVALHVPFESEHEPIDNIYYGEFTWEKGRHPNLSAASFVSLPSYSVINQLLMCCSFLSILFFLAIMKIN
jgi:hypothetical protein